MKRATVFILLIALAFTGSVFALGNPDFSGTWTLDTAKSDIGHARSQAMAGAQKVTIVIKQTPAVFSITRKVGGRSDTANQKLDGSESINKSPSGHDIKSSSRWVGPTLVTRSIMSTGQGTAEMSDIRSLSADGKVMTIEMVRKTPNGEVKRKLIYHKTD